MTLEELQDALLKEQERAKELEAQNNQLTTKNKELEANNLKLMEHNNKLFMRITTPYTEEETPKELTAEEQEEETIKKIRDLMKKEI